MSTVRGQNPTVGIPIEPRCPLRGAAFLLKVRERRLEQTRKPVLLNVLVAAFAVLCPFPLSWEGPAVDNIQALRGDRSSQRGRQIL